MQSQLELAESMLEVAAEDATEREDVLRAKVVALETQLAEISAARDSAGGTVRSGSPELSAAATAAVAAATARAVATGVAAREQQAVEG